MRFPSTAPTTKRLGAASTTKLSTQCLAAAVALGIMLALTSSVSAQARTLTILHTFGAASDGAGPESELLRDPSGNFFGTTNGGGTHGRGAVYEINSTGAETVLHSFTTAPGGRYPQGGLIRDSAGNLFGTTHGDRPTGNSYGTVFKLTPSNRLTNLYTFTGGADGGVPTGTLIRDSAGSFYGTTQNGGIDCPNFNHVAFGCGTVFKLDGSGHETVLYRFTGDTDGSTPTSGVVRDSAGNLYGTAILGGNLSACGGVGCGVVFKIDTAGSFTTLYAFSGGTDGNTPYSALTLDASGNIYGTTVLGGPQGCGTVFKVDSSGTETVLYSFPTPSRPYYGKLLRDPAGYIWGTTSAGGLHDKGTVFRLDPAGHALILHSFTGGADGSFPVFGLIRDSAGNFYGTTLAGGTSAGVVFKLSQ